jgi:arylsulfatase A-like enzyme
MEKPDWLQGRSLMPIVTGETAEIRDAVFAEATYHAAYEPQRAIRTPRWKYVRRFEPRRGPVLPNTDDSPSKDLWMRDGWPENLYATEQLYDLELDPNEACNRIDDPRLQGAADELRVRLERWMAGTDDPLLDGPIPAPSGALVNDADGVSALEPPQVIA